MSLIGSYSMLDVRQYVASSISLVPTLVKKTNEEGRSNLKICFNLIVSCLIVHIRKLCSACHYRIY